MSRRAKGALRWLCAVAAAAALCALVYRYEAAAFGAEKTGAVRWCDAAFVTGALYLSVAALSFVAEKGGFSMLGFALRRIADAFRHPREPDRLRYWEYVRGKERGGGVPWRLLAVGAALLALSVALAVLSGPS